MNDHKLYSKNRKSSDTFESSDFSNQKGANWSILSCNVKQRFCDIQTQQPIIFVISNAPNWTSPRECYVDVYSKHLH